jgi:hypothetical protein
MIPPRKEPDKMGLLVGILRLAKAEGIDPPPAGVQAFRGNGRCKVHLDRIEVYSEAAIEDFLTCAVQWVHQAADRRRSEAFQASKDRTRAALPIGRKAGSVDIARLELDEEHAPQSTRWDTAFVGKLEMDLPC